MAGERNEDRCCVVVGLNQTIDRTIRLPALVAGQVLRATDAVRHAWRQGRQRLPGGA